MNMPMFSPHRMKQHSISKPRLVVYVSREEMAVAKKRAKEKGFTTPHRWLGWVFRNAINAR